MDRKANLLVSLVILSFSKDENNNALIASHHLKCRLISCFLKQFLLYIVGETLIWRTNIEKLKLVSLTPMVNKATFIDSIKLHKEHSFKTFIEELAPLRTYIINSSEVDEVAWLGGKIDAKKEEGIDAKVKTNYGEIRDIQIVFASRTEQEYLLGLIIHNREKGESPAFSYGRVLWANQMEVELDELPGLKCISQAEDEHYLKAFGCRKKEYYRKCRYHEYKVIEKGKVIALYQSKDNCPSSKEVIERALNEIKCAWKKKNKKYSSKIEILLIGFSDWDISGVLADPDNEEQLKKELQNFFEGEILKGCNYKSIFIVGVSNPDAIKCYFQQIC